MIVARVIPLVCCSVSGVDVVQNIETYINKFVDKPAHNQQSTLPRMIIVPMISNTRHTIGNCGKNDNNYFYHHNLIDGLFKLLSLDG
jgi:hypothetical protein